MKDNTTRNTALGGLAATLAVTIAAWFFIDRQTDRGVARLQRIAEVWTVCEQQYNQARTANDTSRVDTRALSVAVDSGKEGAPHRCGDMRRPQDAGAARDSTGKAEGIRSSAPRRN